MSTVAVVLISCLLASSCSSTTETSGGKSSDAAGIDARGGGDQRTLPDATGGGKDVSGTGPVTVSSTRGMKVTTEGSHLFSLNTETQEFELPVRGARNLKLVGILSSADGQRRVVLREAGKDVEVFPAGWLLPGVGAMSDGGTVVVCVNRLVGAATVLTRGAMPDPGAGLALMCRLRKDGMWLDGAVLTPDEGAFWLKDVMPRSGGRFWVVYMQDRSGRLVTLPEPGDGAHRVSFDDSGFGVPKMVHSLHP